MMGPQMFLKKFLVCIWMFPRTFREFTVLSWGSRKLIEMVCSAVSPEIYDVCALYPAIWTDRVMVILHQPAYPLELVCSLDQHYSRTHTQWEIGMCQENLGEVAFQGLPRYFCLKFSVCQIFKIEKGAYRFIVQSPAACQGSRH
jgi:hypothetical protein